MDKDMGDTQRKLARLATLSPKPCNRVMHKAERKFSLTASQLRYFPSIPAVIL